MDISQNGVNFIKQYESFSATAYKGAGEEYWTIGYGHYGPDVQPGDTITEPAALNLLYSDLVSYVNSTNDIALDKFPNMNQDQFDACVSYCYNRGAGRLDGSNGLRQLIYNSDTLQEVSDNFLVYWGTNTDVYDGLMNRRRAEQSLFNGTWEGGSSGGGDQPEPPVIKKKHLKMYLINEALKGGNGKWKSKLF